MNLVWMVHDPARFRHVGQIALNLVALLAAVRTWTIFPFDLTNYEPAGELAVRTLIAVGVVGLIGATIAEVVRFVRGTRSVMLAHRLPPAVAPRSPVLSRGRRRGRGRRRRW